GRSPVAGAAQRPAPGRSRVSGMRAAAGRVKSPARYARRPLYKGGRKIMKPQRTQRPRREELSISGRVNGNLSMSPLPLGGEGQGAGEISARCPLYKGGRKK